MPRIATVEDLKRLLKTVPLPALSAEAGEEVAATIRRIHTREYAACLPALPADSVEWTAETARAREAAWLESLSDEERADRLMEATRTTYRIVALGLVQPEMTWRHAATLHGDADVLALAILRHSGLLKDPEAPAVEAPAPPGEIAPVAA